MEGLMVTATKALDTFLSDAAFWDELGEEVGAIMQPVFRGIMEAGAEVGVEEIEELQREMAKQLAAGPTLLQQTLINETLPAYQDNWWNALSRNTRNGLRKAIDKNIAEAASVAALKKDIVPLFGEARAEAITVTETTRLYAQGANASYRTLGVTHVVWETAMDEVVCPDCEALEGKVFPIDEAPQPPIHVRCRCGLGAAEVAEPAEGAPERQYRDIQATEADNNAHRYLYANMRSPRELLKPDNPYFGMTHAQSKDLLWYKTSGHRDINKFLRIGESPKTARELERVKTAIGTLDEAMTKQVLPDDMLLWRGVQDVPPELLREIRSGNIIGSVITDEGFISSTYERKMGFAWVEKEASTSYVLEIRVSRGTHAIHMEGPFGSAEGEILLNRGTSMRVVGQRTEQGINVLEVEIL